MKLLTTSNPLRKRRDIARWNPFEEMDRLQSELSSIWERWPENRTMSLTDWSPPVDITEDDQEFLIKAELPEVKKDDIKVTVEDGVLSITGERRSETEEKDKKFHRVERSYGRFERSFSLPSETVAEEIASEFKDGVLTVHLPKRPEAAPQATEIEVR